MALIQCPECQLQVSDKALSCPHCGYPMTKTSTSRQTNLQNANDFIMDLVESQRLKIKISEIASEPLSL
ncbi:MAG: zinc-ribbon domain-containing protein [Hungatella sp.]